MKKRIKIWLFVMLMVTIVFPKNILAAENTDIKNMVKETSEAMKVLSGSSLQQVLADKDIFQAGNSICDWVAITWAFSDEKEDYETYRNRLEAYVTSCYEKKGYIDETKATETQRIALTVLALGEDPTQFGTDAEGNPVNLVADGTYNFQLRTVADGETGASKSYESGDYEELDLGKQGINGYIYGLLLLDAKGYEIPKDKDITKEVLIDSILSAQSEDGGFSLAAGGKGNIDITAMALQALAPYKEQEKVGQSIEKAINWLGEHMTEYATFNYHGEDSSESSSQVILAMCALGIDITTEERLIKNGMNLLDGLNLFRLDDGNYMHTMNDGNGNLMSSQQALLALNALEKFNAGEGWILNLTDYTGPLAVSGSEVGTNGLSSSMLVILFVVAILAAGIVIMRRKNEL